MENFRNQIKEDLEFFREEYSNLDSNLKKESYAFNLWVMTKIYNIDEEVALANITEYNDKGIDCFVHFEESRELFLIQNKFYDENTVLSRKDVSDFLVTPLSQLKEGKYKRSMDLQELFNIAKNDPNYRIWLHFYITNDKKNTDVKKAIDDFNRQKNDLKAEIRAKIFYLEDIYRLYYGGSFKENLTYKFTLKTINQDTVLRILPEVYNLPGMSKAYYIMTPIKDLFEMYKGTLDKQYPLFEENIREYLGNSNINNGIVKTLKDKDDRKNFFYYNNGITIICEDISQTTSPYSLTLYQPQIVNGCQTVNTIYEVLSSYNEGEIDKEFNGVYVMVKIFIKESKDINFYRDVVKYTNSQNAISEKAFASSTEYFLSLQKYFRERGFLLSVKPSDKNMFKEEFKDKVKLNKMIAKARKFTTRIGVNIKNINSIMIPLDKLLQVYLAFVEDGYYAYTKKNRVLKIDSEIYQKYSLKIDKYFTVDNMIRLFTLFKKAEIERKKSQDKKTPIPYYLIGFIGYFIPEELKNSKKFNEALNILFTQKDKTEEIYNYFKLLTNLYKAKHPVEYNVMIKKKIDNKLLEDQISTLKTLGEEAKIEDYLNFLKK